MRIVIVGSGQSIHTQRWANGLASRGHRVTLVTQHYSDDHGGLDRDVRQIVLPHRGERGYLTNATSLRRIVRLEQPDVVNVHYASGYGTMATLARVRPILLNVWGSDVYDFPTGSRARRWLVRTNLKRASGLASTSHVMANQVRRLWPEASGIHIVPFGVDTSLFHPGPERIGPTADSSVVVGTVKTLDEKYGIDTLLRAFALLRHRANSVQVSLHVYGDGPDRAELERLSERLGIANRVIFFGRVAHSEVPRVLRTFDVFAAPSTLDSESFGVAVVEASAAGLPVIVSDAGGLPEVVRDGVTGYVVRRSDPCALADAMDGLVASTDARIAMGLAGREHVRAAYEWTRCLELMEDALEHVAAGAQ